MLIGELGLPHESIDAGGPAGGLDAPGFLAMNPHGRVPVIDDGGTVVWESHAILRYLAARHAPSPFWADDPAARSLADRWMDWAQTTLQPAFLTGVFGGFYRTPEAQRDTRAVADSIAACTRHFSLLDRELSGRPYLAGDRLTLADIPAATTLYRYFGLDIPRPSIPHVEDWYRWLTDRPAYREHVMVPFDDMKGRLDF